MMLRVISIAIVLAFALAAWSASEHKAPNAGLALVHADYRLCVNVKPANPLLRTPNSSVDYRIDPNAFNDKGTS